jgi:hypothetical protein
VTLLLATSTAEEAMPLFLERMMPAWASIIVSVCLVLIFAEVIPMALCTRYGLDVGAKLSWLVRIFIVIAYPIAWPISKALDWLFGHSAGTLFKRSQLKELINMHSKHSIHSAQDVEAELKKLPVEDRLSSHEVQLIKNTLDLNSRVAIEISTMIDEVYMLEYSQICDRDVIGSIVHFGLHFCVPVYKENRDNIIGVIRVGDLISLSPDDNKPISALELDPIPKLPSDAPVYHALTILQAQKSSLALLVDPHLTRIPVAVLTVEDIIEELVQGQLVDIDVFPRSMEGENLLEEWMAPAEEDELGLETMSIGSAYSHLTTESMPAMPHRKKHFHDNDSDHFSRGGSNHNHSSNHPNNLHPFSPTAQNNSVVLLSTPQPKKAGMMAGAHLRSPGEIRVGMDKQDHTSHPPSPLYWSRPPLVQSSSFGSLPPYPTTKLIPVTQIDIVEAAHNESRPPSPDHVSLPDLNSTPLKQSRSRIVRPIDYEYASNSGSESSAYTAPTILTPALRRKHKDPMTSHLVEKKLTAASVLATALKRSSSNVPNSTSHPLPIIYKRNHLGDAVVDPSKLLSASYGDIHDLLEEHPETEDLPKVSLSASHGDLPEPEEEGVRLDW